MGERSPWHPRGYSDSRKGHDNGAYGRAALGGRSGDEAGLDGPSRGAQVPSSRAALEWASCSDSAPDIPPAGPSLDASPVEPLWARTRSTKDKAQAHHRSLVRMVNGE